MECLPKEFRNPSNLLDAIVPSCRSFDSINEVCNRYLVLLWYLNDVEVGGETRFPQLDVKVQARAGRLLMFPPYWMYQHEGLPPQSGDKYIISTYLLFQPPAT